MLVILNPPGYMLTTSSFALFIWGIFYIFHLGQLSSVSVEHRAESGEWILESKEFELWWTNLIEGMPMTVELEIFWVQFVEKVPQSRRDYNLIIFHQQVECEGVEEYISYERSCSVVSKWLRVKLGLTSSTIIKHQHKINNEWNGDLQKVDGNKTNELKKIQIQT